MSDNTFMGILTDTYGNNEHLPVSGGKWGSCSASVFGGGCVVAGDTEDTTEKNSSSEGLCSDNASKATT